MSTKNFDSPWNQFFGTQTSSAAGPSSSSVTSTSSTPSNSRHFHPPQQKGSSSFHTTVVALQPSEVEMAVRMYQKHDGGNGNGIPRSEEAILAAVESMAIHAPRLSDVRVAVQNGLRNAGETSASGHASTSSSKRGRRPLTSSVDPKVLLAVQPPTISLHEWLSIVLELKKLIEELQQQEGEENARVLLSSEGPMHDDSHPIIGAHERARREAAYSALVAACTARHQQEVSEGILHSVSSNSYNQDENGIAVEEGLTMEQLQRFAAEFGLRMDLIIPPTSQLPQSSLSSSVAASPMAASVRGRHVPFQSSTRPAVPPQKIQLEDFMKVLDNLTTDQKKKRHAASMMQQRYCCEEDETDDGTIADSEVMRLPDGTSSRQSMCSNSGDGGGDDATVVVVDSMGNSMSAHLADASLYRTHNTASNTIRHGGPSNSASAIHHAHPSNSLSPSHRHHHHFSQEASTNRGRLTPGNPKTIISHNAPSNQTLTSMNKILAKHDARVTSHRDQHWVLENVLEDIPFPPQSPKFSPSRRREDSLPLHEPKHRIVLSESPQRQEQQQHPLPSFASSSEPAVNRPPTQPRQRPESARTRPVSVTAVEHRPTTAMLRPPPPLVSSSSSSTRVAAAARSPPPRDRLGSVSAALQFDDDDSADRSDPQLEQGYTKTQKENLSEKAKSALQSLSQASGYMSEAQHVELLRKWAHTPPTVASTPIQQQGFSSRRNTTPSYDQMEPARPQSSIQTIAAALLTRSISSSQPPKQEVPTANNVPQSSSRAEGVAARGGRPSSSRISSSDRFSPLSNVYAAKNTIVVPTRPNTAGRFRDRPSSAKRAAQGPAERTTSPLLQDHVLLEEVNMKLSARAVVSPVTLLSRPPTVVTSRADAQPPPPTRSFSINSAALPYDTNNNTAASLLKRPSTTQAKEVTSSIMKDRNVMAQQTYLGAVALSPKKPVNRGRRPASTRHPHPNSKQQHPSQPREEEMDQQRTPIPAPPLQEVPPPAVIVVTATSTPLEATLASSNISHTMPMRAGGNLVEVHVSAATEEDSRRLQEDEDLGIQEDDASGSDDDGDVTHSSSNERKSGGGGAGGGYGGNHSRTSLPAANSSLANSSAVHSPDHGAVRGFSSVDCAALLQGSGVEEYGPYEGIPTTLAHHQNSQNEPLAPPLYRRGSYQEKEYTQTSSVGEGDHLLVPDLQHQAPPLIHRTSATGTPHTSSYQILNDTASAGTSGGTATQSTSTPSYTGGAESLNVEVSANGTRSPRSQPVSRNGSNLAATTHTSSRSPVTHSHLSSTARSVSNNTTKNGNSSRRSSSKPKSPGTTNVESKSPPFQSPLNSPLDDGADRRFLKTPNYLSVGQRPSNRSSLLSNASGRTQRSGSSRTARTNSSRGSSLFDGIGSLGGGTPRGRHLSTATSSSRHSSEAEGARGPLEDVRRALHSLHKQAATKLQCWWRRVQLLRRCMMKRIQRCGRGLYDRKILGALASATAAALALSGGAPLPLKHLQQQYQHRDSVVSIPNVESGMFLPERDPFAVILSPPSNAGTPRNEPLYVGSTSLEAAPEVSQGSSGQPSEHEESSVNNSKGGGGAWNEDEDDEHHHHHPEGGEESHDEEDLSKSSFSDAVVTSDEEGGGGLSALLGKRTTSTTKKKTSSEDSKDSKKSAGRSAASSTSRRKMDTSVHSVGSWTVRRRNSAADAAPINRSFEGSVPAGSGAARRRSLQPESSLSFAPSSQHRRTSNPSYSSSNNNNNIAFVHVPAQKQASDSRSNNPSEDLQQVHSGGGWPTFPEFLQHRKSGVGNESTNPLPENGLSPRPPSAASSTSRQQRSNRLSSRASNATAETSPKHVTQSAATPGLCCFANPFVSSFNNVSSTPSGQTMLSSQTPVTQLGSNTSGTTTVGTSLPDGNKSPKQQRSLRGSRRQLQLFEPGAGPDDTVVFSPTGAASAEDVHYAAGCSSSNVELRHKSPRSEDEGGGKFNVISTKQRPQGGSALAREQTVESFTHSFASSSLAGAGLLGGNMNKSLESQHLASILSPASNHNSNTNPSSSGSSGRKHELPQEEDSVNQEETDEEQEEEDSGDISDRQVTDLLSGLMDEFKRDASRFDYASRSSKHHFFTAVALQRLQRIGRAYRERCTLFVTREAKRCEKPARLIQSCGRMWFAARNLAKIRRAVLEAEEELELWNKHDAAAVVVQRTVRAWFAMTHYKAMRRKVLVRSELRVVSEIPED